VHLLVTGTGLATVPYPYPYCPRTDLEEEGLEGRRARVGGLELRLALGQLGGLR
jgi:hypothetical protein